MYLYNTLTKKIEKFEPLNPPLVTFYSCGPTVYDYTHIGHLRSYVNNDLLKRTLLYLGYQVKHVMNITDVGHLTSDADAGEDKMEKGAKKEKKTVWQVAQYYTDYFLNAIKRMNILMPDTLCPATENIQEMIKLIAVLEKKGFVYETKEAVYFNTKKLKDYGKLQPQKKGKKEGAREEVYVDPDKKNPEDFSLWFKKVGRFKNHAMSWPSPWGEGFPGWHIECSAMSMKYLGETIDIHAGGIEHIPIHHTNEIAQSEAATGKEFVRYWFHNHHLLVNGQKMSKSLNNFYTLDDIEKKGFEPMALRYFYLQSHYRQTINFTWEALRSSQNAYQKLKNWYLNQLDNKDLSSENLKDIAADYLNRFKQKISYDLQIPQALAITWEMIKSNLPQKTKKSLFDELNKIFGLKFQKITYAIPKNIILLARQREKARKEKKFLLADRIRTEIESLGYLVIDQKPGFKIVKKNNP